MRSARDTTWRYRVGAASGDYLDRKLGDGWRFKYNGHGWWGGCAHRCVYVRYEVDGVLGGPALPSATLCCDGCGRDDLATAAVVLTRDYKRDGPGAPWRVTTEYEFHLNGGPILRACVGVTW